MDNKEAAEVIAVMRKHEIDILKINAFELAIKALEQEPCSDAISRQAAIDVLAEMQGRCTTKAALIQNSKIWQQIKDLPSVQPEIVRCKDCKFYSPMNREIKTGICNLTMHQNFGDNWFCAGAERRQNG